MTIKKEILFLVYLDLKGYRSKIEGGWMDGWIDR
jgi:hypothetical protein